MHDPTWRNSRCTACRGNLAVGSLRAATNIHALALILDGGPSMREGVLRGTTTQAGALPRQPRWRPDLLAAPAFRSPARRLGSGTHAATSPEPLPARQRRYERKFGVSADPIRVHGRNCRQRQLPSDPPCSTARDTLYGRGNRAMRGPTVRRALVSVRELGVPSPLAGLRSRAGRVA